MCDILRIKNDAGVIVEVEDVGTLSKFMPRVCFDNRYHGAIPPPDNACLCPVHIPATCAANGYKVTQQENGDYAAVKRFEGDAK